MSPYLVFLIGLVVFLLLVFLSMPIGFAFGIVGFLGVILIRGLDPALTMLGRAPWDWSTRETLICVPLFILMGQISFCSGICKDLFETANKWVGNLPGGLALATMLACTGFAACTGSSVASSATMGLVAYPEMKRFNYDDRLGTGCIAAGGTLGILIPPSIGFIVYGFITETSIAELFIGGIFPGLMLSGLFLVMMFVLCKRNPKLGPPGLRFPWNERFASLRGIWSMLLLFFIVIGGLFFGVFTSSEAGAVGAFGAFAIALSRRTPKAMFINAVRDSLKLSCMIITIMIGAMIFNSFVALTNFSPAFANWIMSLSMTRYEVLVVILLIYVPLGMVMDSFAMIILTMPIVFPVITALGFHPVWFGVLVVLMMELGMITPPVGLNVFVVQAVTKVPLQEVFRGALPYAITMVFAEAILIVFPQISLLLPTIMM